jgi:hypothetical protein
MLTVAAGMLAAIFLHGTAAAQLWWVDAGAGAATHEAIADRTTSSLNLGLRLQAPIWIYGAGGLPLDADGLPWVAGGGGGRIAAGSGLIWGVDAEAHGYLFRAAELDATGSGVVTEALPFIGTSRGPIRLEGFAGAQYYVSTFLDGSDSRTLYSGGVRATTILSPAVSLGSEARYALAEEAGYPYAGMQLTWAGDQAGIWAGGGRWFDERIPTTEWSIGGYLDAGARARLSAAYRQDANDPLYWNEPRRSWNVSIAYALGERPAPLRPAAPEIVDGRALFRVPVAESRSAPEIAGDFTGWSRVPMERDGAYWVARLHVPPGVHRYAFRAADGTWFLPESIPRRVDDGFGGENAVLIVP